jgi:hypothetical protein
MKKNLLFAFLGLTLVLFTVSCSKTDTTPPAATTAEGKWVGSFTSLGPSHYLALIFKPNSVLLVEANALPDIANGTWNISGDSLRATFTYTGAVTGTYSIAGKYAANSIIMDGTMGPGTSTTGAGVFSVTKQ